MARANLIGIDILLRIDGHIRQLTDVEAFFLRDPYPGGHRFFLGFEGPTAERILGDVAAGRFAPPTQDQARTIMLALNMFLQRVPRGGVAMLLNTVDDLSVERGRIHLSGVCSPLLKKGAA